MRPITQEEFEAWELFFNTTSKGDLIYFLANQAKAIDGLTGNHRAFVAAYRELLDKGVTPSTSASWEGDNN